MNASYSVFPETRHVLETFRGSIGYTNVMQLLARQARDRRVGLCQHTIMDFTKATLALTNEQVRIITDTIGLRSARPRKYAMVIANARNFAIASLFAACLSRDGFSVRCFHSRAAAVRWITASEEGNTTSQNIESFATLAHHREINRSLENDSRNVDCVLDGAQPA